MLNRERTDVFQLGMRLGSLILMWLCAVPVFGVAAVEAAPDPGEIIDRAVRRASALSAASPKAVHVYDKRTTIETLDSRGRVTKTKVKLFEVTLEGGVPDARLTRIEGRRLSERQLRKEDEAMRRRRRIFLGQDEKSGAAKRGTFVPKDMAQRFEVSYIGVERVNGRATHALAFAPKSPEPVAATLADRVANQMHGKLWIDVAENEIARIEVKLRRKVKLWGGILGRLDVFDYTLDRRRSPGGVWHNDEADILLDARGFWKRLRFHVVEKASRFREVRGTLGAGRAE